MTAPTGLVSVVVPVYNSPAAAELARQIRAVLSSHPAGYELIFVDDASSAVIDALKAAGQDMPSSRAAIFEKAAEKAVERANDFAGRQALLNPHAAGP